MPSSRASIVAGVVTSVALLRILSVVLRNQIFIPKLTILADIPHLGKPRKGGKLRGRAVICGGSIAGLFSAAVCADHFDETVIIEPESWLSSEDGVTFRDEPMATRPSEAGHNIPINPRKRVMQYTSTHATQPISLHALRELFPNFDEEAADIGGRPAPCDLNMYIGGQHLETPHNQPDYQGAPVETIFLSRPAYETLLRRLIRKYRPNVTFMKGSVTGLQLSEADSSTVVGVHVRNDDNSDVLEKGDLVVDATGPAQAGFCKWLKERNIPSNLRVQYEPNLYYVTAIYQIPPSLWSKLPIPGLEGVGGPRWLYSFFPETERETKSFIMGVNEHSKLIMTCGGWMNLERPHSPAEIKDYLNSISTSHPISAWVLELMDVLNIHRDELNGAYVDLKVPPCSYIKYHEASSGSVPRNFVAVGDSVMKANPVFAQGMAKACIGAATLDRSLRKLRNLERGFPPDFSTSYFALHASRVGGIWDPAKDTDYGVKTTVPIEGETLEVGEGSRKIFKYAVKVALKDPGIAATLWNVRMFLAPATDILSLRLIVKVGWEWMRS